MAQASVSVSSQQAEFPARRPHGLARPTPGESMAITIDAIFCPQDVADPFDTVEWDLRTAAIKGEGGRGAVRANQLRNSRDVEPIGHQRRGAASISTARSNTPERETQRPAVDPPRQPHDRRLGHRGRLFRHAPKTASASIAT